jgi:hypothetical protein
VIRYDILLDLCRALSKPSVVQSSSFFVDTELNGSVATCLRGCSQKSSRKDRNQNFDQ